MMQMKHQYLSFRNVMLVIIMIDKKRDAFVTVSNVFSAAQSYVPFNYLYFETHIQCISLNLILNKFLSNGIRRKLKIVNIRITKYPYNKILIVIQCDTPSFEEKKTNDSVIIY